MNKYIPEIEQKRNINSLISWSQVCAYLTRKLHFQSFGVSELQSRGCGPTQKCLLSESQFANSQQNIFSHSKTKIFK